jgi:hypothetical protein
VAPKSLIASSRAVTPLKLASALKAAQVYLVNNSILRAYYARVGRAVPAGKSASVTMAGGFFILFAKAEENVITNSQ